MAAHPSSRGQALSLATASTRSLCANSTVVLEPVREKVESGESVVILSVSLLLRRRADVERRDPPYLRPQGPAVSHGHDRCRMGSGPSFRGCRAARVGAASG